MENKPQTPQTVKPTRDASAGEADDAGRQMFAKGTPRDTRVTEPAVATDGQIVEAGYGHGV